MSGGLGRRAALGGAAGVALGAGIAALAADEPVIRVRARRFAFDPPTVTLNRGVATVLELTSRDRMHGFRIPALAIRLDVVPGEVRSVRVVAETAGSFPMFCDVFCGDDHEEMNGTVVVREG